MVVDCSGYGPEIGPCEHGNNVHVPQETGKSFQQILYSKELVSDCTIV
jgi:hypothetical protein